MEKDNVISDPDIVSELWHWKVEDNLSWLFCSGILKQNYGVEITAQEVKKKFLRYFKSRSGVILYSKCLKCGNGKMMPRKSVYGYFISCSEFPRCDNKANVKKI